MRLMADGQAVGSSPPTLAELRHRRAEILDLTASFGAHNVRVFGSVARGTENADSDLDLLVDLTPGTGLLRWAEMIVALERLLGCPVEVATEASLRHRIRSDVLAEAVPL
jgi:predicted nucleotidyltransferase